MLNRQALTALPFLAIMFGCTAAFGQIDTPMIPPERDLGDLSRRASSSRTVVVGTVTKSEGVTKRMSASVLEKMRTSLDEAFGGSLYTIQVQESLCKEENFRPGSTVGVHDEDKVYFLYVPRDEPLWMDGFQKESLQEGRRYLLFLQSPNPSVERMWLSSFQLHPKRRYYRGTQRSRGIVPLNDSSPKGQAVLEKVTELCQAVRPPKLSDKLANLKGLVDSDDPILRVEAQLAIEILRSRTKARR